jgi:hypothetical protein
MTPTETRKIARPRPAVPNAPRSDHRGEIEVCRAGFFALMMARRLRYALSREHLVASPQSGGGAAACGQQGSSFGRARCRVRFSFGPVPSWRYRKTAVNPRAGDDERRTYALRRTIVPTSRPGRIGAFFCSPGEQAGPPR